MKAKISVKSDLLDGGYHEFPAIYNDYESYLKVVWKEKFDDDEEESIFELTYDKELKEAVLVRKGGISSRMVFKKGVTTQGAVTSRYGTIPVEFYTNNLCMPDKVSNRICIDYEIVGTTKNTFEAVLNFQ
ncbi:MAG: DUF1934 domain-containing protein [Clostridia bacterium]|nr:DUF1934 domain-containing protein [Clostridia bacterium]